MKPPALRRGPTRAFERAELDELRAFLERAFDGDLSPEDWEHALGGTHVWLRDEDGFLAHASVVPRTLTTGTTSLRTGYIEAVATRADRRG